MPFPRPPYRAPLQSTSDPCTGGPLSKDSNSPLGQQLLELGNHLEGHAHGDLVHGVLEHLLAISHHSQERGDWEFLNSTMADIAHGLKVFNAHRHGLKVGVVGSARVPPQSAVYQQAMALSQQLVALGFEVITGAGGGVMEAANRGAGVEKGFGLTIQLPFEFLSNPYIDADTRLVAFRYFSNRKHFLLQESQALVALPGGMGTLDELFEALTLLQTGKAAPMPVVLLAPPGDDYWQGWQNHLMKVLEARGMVSAADGQIYTVADSVEAALEVICGFYRVVHSCRFLEKDRLQLLLHKIPTDDQLQTMNQMFAHLVRQGAIERCSSRSQQGLYPGLELQVDCRHMGHLYRLIHYINSLP